MDELFEMAIGKLAHEKAGSVGAAWPPCYDAHNARIKGFSTQPVGRMRDAGRLFGAIREAEQENPQATRTTVRAFVRSGLVEGLRRSAPYSIEASFYAGDAAPGHDLVYFARTSECRLPRGEILSRELESVRGLAGVERADLDEAKARVASNGYSLSRLHGVAGVDVERILLLYREAYQEYTFQITQQAITGMLENGNIVIVGQDRDSKVVSSLVAEHVEIMAGERRIHLFELSDYATFRAHRGNGLITLMQMEAISAIRSRYGPGAIIYAEDRAAWGAVNRSSHKAGLVHCGVLPNHCVLVSDRDFGEEGRFETLNVWAHLPARA